MERLTTNVPGLTICFSKCLDIFLSFKVSLLHRLVPDTLPHVAFPLHRPHGHLHVVRWGRRPINNSLPCSLSQTAFLSLAQASSGTLPDPTLCQRTTWLLESLQNIGGWTLPGGFTWKYEDNNLKIFVCLGLKVVLPDGTVLSVKPVKSMVKI